MDIITNGCTKLRQPVPYAPRVEGQVIGENHA
jgi:hypothetical protein